MEIVLSLIAIFVLIVVVALTRGMQLRALVQNGVPMRATVDKKWHHSSGGRRIFRLRYSYQVESGKHLSRSVMVSEAEFQNYETGDAIDIVVLKNRPGNSALASMVALSKQALDKKTEAKKN